MANSSRESLFVELKSEHAVRPSHIGRGGKIASDYVTRITGGVAAQAYLVGNGAAEFSDMEPTSASDAVPLAFSRINPRGARTASRYVTQVINGATSRFCFISAGATEHYHLTPLYISQPSAYSARTVP